MRLYILHKCPYGHRAAIALREKKLDFDVVFFEAGKRPKELEAAGPRAKSPTLFDAETTVTDSAVVLEYLEDRYPAPALLPDDPEGRARVRMLIARYNDEVGSKHGPLIVEAYIKSPRDEAKVDAAKKAFLDALPAWDEYLKGRTFADGNDVTLADITMYTLFPAAKTFAGVEIPAELTHLRSWFERMQSRDATALPAPS
jgi:glutathione S-transferase